MPEEDGSSISSSPFGSEISGYRHSTHTSKATPGPDAGAKITIGASKEPRSLSDHMHPGPEVPTDVSGSVKNPSSPSLLSPSGFWQSSPARPSGSVSSAAEPPDHDVRDPSRVQASHRETSCNFLSSDSEEERLQSSRYAAVATAMARERKDRRASRETNSSSSFSSTPSEDESIDVEPDLPGVEREDTHPPIPVTQVHKALVSAQEGLSRSILVTPRDAPSEGEGRSDNEGSWRLRKRPSVELHEGAEHADDPAGSQYCDGNRARCHGQSMQDQDILLTPTTGHSDSVFQSNSSSTIDTESPSHGTYSVKSAMSEEPLDLREIPDVLSVDEDELASRSQSYLTVSKDNTGTTRSLSPVPLKSDSSERWRNQGITVLGSRSTSSVPSSPEKLIHSGSAHLPESSRDESFDASNQSEERDHGVERKKKKKKKRKGKKSKDKSRNNEGSHDDSELKEETSHAQQKGDNLPSPLRSIMHPQHHSDHHVHWPDED